ncbi:MAG: putative DNA polymerase [Prokaryotic dsDNA virus sp.]|nr:MAG: putative DNA polymerase [Prokaryotic dsDNA virus sp.]
MKKQEIKNISIDFETYSECDIRKSGAYAYADHPTTEVLCLAWKVDDEQPNLWTPEKPIPQRLLDLIEEGALVWAWNSFFEMSIWNLILKWKPIPLSQWRDTAALAAAQAYPRALGKCGEALGLEEDAAKSKRGKILIQRCCKPYRGKRVIDNSLYKELYDYCLQDVVAETNIRKKLRNLRGIEQDIWEHDQLVNWRGVRLDSKNINNALEIIKIHTKTLNNSVYAITEGELDSTSSRAKSLEWINMQGYKMDSYDKNAVQCALDDDLCPQFVKQFLEIRQALSKSSNKKYEAMKCVLGKDNRAHGVLMYHGAATGRWAGRHFQPQNLPRPLIENVDSVIESMKFCDPAMINGEPMEALSSCLRGMLIASEGNRLIVCDYASIEARVLAWLANHTFIINVFNSGKDIYKSTASSMYGCDYEEVSSDQRFVGKIATLALGYQGGVRAFQKMAEAYGTDVSEEQALKIRNDWREANSPIVKLWIETERAAKNAISYGKEYNCSKGTFKFLNNDLLFKLPSGRILSFPEAKLSQGDRGVELIYKGMNNHTHSWGDIKAYGGSLVQSITQAVARDLLAEAVLRLEKNGYPIVLHVHDEIIADVPEGFGSIEDFSKQMCVLPKWAKGIPVEAEGYESKRYKK